MKHEARKLVAIAIVVAEICSIGVATTSASAQESATQLTLRQQRRILQQQRQIEQNQRRLDAQEQRLAQSAGPGYGSPVPRNIDRGIFGNIGNCPVGWTYSLFSGCLPALAIVH